MDHDLTRIATAARIRSRAGFVASLVIVAGIGGSPLAAVLADGGLRAAPMVRVPDLPRPAIVHLAMIPTPEALVAAADDGTLDGTVEPDAVETAAPPPAPKRKVKAAPKPEPEPKAAPKPEVVEHATPIPAAAKVEPPAEPAPSTEPQDVEDQEVAEQDGEDQEGAEQAGEQASSAETETAPEPVAAAAPRHPRVRPAPPRRGRRARNPECEGFHPDIGQQAIDRWVVRRSLVQHHTASVKRINELAHGGPWRSEDGAERGWRIVGFGCASPLWKGGLRSGDVVQRVNGKKLYNIGHAIGLWITQRHRDDFDIEVLRRGKPVTLHYHLI